MAIYTIMRDLLHDQRAATAVEYGLIIAMIVLVMVSALQSVATATIEMWDGVEENIVPQ